MGDIWTKMSPKMWVWKICFDEISTMFWNHSKPTSGLSGTHSCIRFSKSCQRFVSHDKCDIWQENLQELFCNGEQHRYVRENGLKLIGFEGGAIVPLQWLDDVLDDDLESLDILPLSLENLICALLSRKDDESDERSTKQTWRKRKNRFREKRWIEYSSFVVHLRRRWCEFHLIGL